MIISQRKIQMKDSILDVLGYINRGKLPEYLGGNKIVEVEQKNCSVKLYNIQNNEDK